MVIGSVCLPLSRGLRTMRTLTEWRAWWRLQGRSMTTQREYQRYLVQLAQRVSVEEATLADVLEFVADGATPALRRQRSRSCRAWRPPTGRSDATRRDP